MNKEHGSPYDLGSADSYYKRPISINPEWSKEDQNAYLTGYFDQEMTGDHKDYGDDYE